jgi:hypothetical protein
MPIVAALSLAGAAACGSGGDGAGSSTTTGSGGYSGPGTGTGTGSGTNAGTGTTGGGTQSPSITTTIVLKQGCQWIHTEGPVTVPDIPGLYCFQSVRDKETNKVIPTLVDAFLQSNRTLVFRQDYNPKFQNYDVRYWYSTQMWTRAPAGQAGPVTLCWRLTTSVACEWVTSEEYSQRVYQQRRDQQQAAQAQANAAAAAAANRAETQRQINAFEERKIEMTKIFTAPECVHSYNGCGY